MKNSIVSLFFCLCLCLTFAFQTSIVVAQKSESLIAAKAVGDGENGVVVQWEIEPRTSSLGYNIYRLEKDGAVLVNPQMIVGSSMITAEKAKYFRDNLYSFYDSEGTLGSRYVIETIDLSFNRQKTTVQTEFVESILPLTEHQSVALDDLSNITENAEIAKDYPETPTDKSFRILNENLVQNSEKQKWVAAQPGAKIAVKADGLYRVPRAMLATTNFNINAPVANWQLYADGIEQPMIVEPNGEYVEFYGRGVDNRFTDTRFYYLVAGDAPGRRMNVNARRLTNTQLTARNFSNNFKFKQRRVYIGDLLNGEEENWFGFAIGSEPTPPLNVVVNVKGIDTSVAQTLVTLRIQGQSSSAHSVTVKLNNAIIGTITGAGRVAMEKQFSVPTSLLIEGDNTFSLSSSAGSFALFDTVNIAYKRSYTAESNRLTFTTANGRATRVQGFTSSNVRVFDISDPNGTALVNARNEGNGSIFIPASRPQMLFAVGEAGILTPAAGTVTSNTPSTVLTSAAGKDLVIVSHGNFTAAVETLATYRRSQGLTVEVVNVEDVYDESGYGYISPLSLSSFLQSVNPKYILLVGDGNYDQRNYFFSAFSNFVPTRNFETLFGEAVSDSELVDFNNDNIEDIPIGRLPVNTVAGLQNIINKILAFETTVSNAMMQRGSLFVNDDPVGWDFLAANQRVRGELPAGMPVKFIKRSDGAADVVRQQIINDINSGRFIVAYAGHGQIGAWWATAAFRTSDATALTNTIYPLFLPLNCLNGAFGDPFNESLAEAMVEATGGAVLAWSSSALTFPDQQELMAVRFFRALGSGEFGRIGDAVKASKSATNDADVRRSWILIGDPTLKVK